MKKKVRQVIIEKIVTRDGKVTSHRPGYDPDLGIIYHEKDDSYEYATI